MNNKPSSDSPARHHVERSSTTEGLPVAPSMGPSIEAVEMPSQAALVDRRLGLIVVLCVALAAVAAVVAQGLMWLIALITNLSFHGKFSAAGASPWDNHLGLWVMLVPVGGAVLVG